MTLYTVGHSTRSLDELIEVLRAHGVARLVDVRRFPGSRRHPHFGRDVLERALPEAGIAYEWRGQALGGRRSARKGSPHTAWTVKGFAAYADHLDTEEAEAALDELLAAARREPTAVMCAEALPHRCHRRLIADRAVARGWEVVHLLDAARAEPHELPPFARVDGERVIYDVEEEGAQRALF